MIRGVERVCRGAAGPLAILHQACFPEDPWDVTAITEIMGIPGFFGRVASEDGMPVGFALALDLGTECEILSLGVVPDRRRDGIGSALLDAVCCEALRRGAAGVALEMAVDNDAARALYVTRGFIPVGRRRNYYRQRGRLVDALIFHLTLAPASQAT
jgi:[ribosomal protein S18]-alanine N-acetyltransferase